MRNGQQVPRNRLPRKAFTKECRCDGDMPSFRLLRLRYKSVRVCSWKETRVST